MELRLLIDGYNLLFATGAAQPRGSGAELARARERMLGQLAQLLDAQQRGTTQIVFDAGSGRRTGENTYAYQGMVVSFASDFTEADDLLEQLIRQHPQPRRLTVISSDQRVQRCARARKANWMTCDEWLMQALDKIDRQPGSAGPTPHTSGDDTDAHSDKPITAAEALAPADVARWLREFGWSPDDDRS